MSKKVLVAPLNWGLGHASRCIPIISALLNAGFEVMVAADGKIKALLQEEFPKLTFIQLKGYRLTYSKTLPAWFKIFLQFPQILSRIIIEHRALKKIIVGYKIDIVISDNRFGLWNKNICSVYITHQLMIKCPGALKIFEPVIHSIHAWIIEKYTWCWIPDYEGSSNLSGELSHKYSSPPNGKFIGPLSRFTKNQQANNSFIYDLCIIISGPEPLRTEFETIVLSQLHAYDGKVILILGRPGEKQDTITGHIRIVSHLGSERLSKVISDSRFVVCRAGYSSIMDLFALGKDALLVPTHGQTEQEYLGRFLSSKKIFSACSQSEFNLNSCKPKAGFSIKNLAMSGGNTALSEAIKNLTDSANNIRA